MESCPRNGPLIADKEQGYVVICIDGMAHEGSFLFWKTEGRGYTSDIDQAGIWENEPTSIRDVVIPLNILLAHFKTKRIVGGNLLELQGLIERKQKNKISLKKGKKL